jgi:hypothetical protein
MTTTASIARRTLHHITAIISDCNYAQQRLLAARLAPDGYMNDPDIAPETYAEFLFRTSMPLRHEPGARRMGRVT